MSVKKCRQNGWVALAVLVLIPVFLGARTTPAPAQTSPNQTGASGAPQGGLQNFQAISQTGILPMFAVDMKFDPTWVDGASVPSASAQYGHSGVNDSFQQAWEALKPAGFNMIRFPLDTADAQSPARLANLCIWARANNVTLIPVLRSPASNAKSTAANAISAFPPAVVSLLRAGDGQSFTAYTQVSYFQVEGAMNHAGLYPKLAAGVAQQTLLTETNALRNSEAQALQGTNVQPTPIMIVASLDYEMILQGAIAGVPLDPTMEQKAETSLLQYLSPFATAPNIEAVNVEWFPRSISSGDVDRFAPLLRQLKTALPSKQITLTTGFSSAFNSADQQAQFFTLTFTNLSDFRASDGVNSLFLGIAFRQAFKGPLANANPPAGSVDTSQWNWAEKAQQLSQMWSQGKNFPDLKWWLNKVQDNLGLLAAQANGGGGMNPVAQPAMQSFQQISSTVAQVTQNAASFAPPAAPPVSGDTSYPPSSAYGMPQNSAFPSPAPMNPSAGAVSSYPGTSGYGMPQNSAFPGSAPMVPPACPASSYPTTSGFVMPQTPMYPGPGLMAPPAGMDPQYAANSAYGMPQASTYPEAAPSFNSSNSMAAMSCPGAPGYPAGAQPNSLSAGTPYQQMLFGVLSQITSQLTTSLVSRFTNGFAQGDPSQFAGYSSLNSSLNPGYGTPQQSGYGTTDPNATAGANSASSGLNGASSGQGGTATGGQSSGTQPAQSNAIQPQIAFFGPSGQNATGTSGQIPPLTAQIANPSTTGVLPAGQAQFSVDGVPNQIVSLGAMIPKQTLSVVFTAVPATTGSHSVQVVVTSSGGGTSSAISSVNVTAPAATSSGGTQTASSNNSSSGASISQPGVRAPVPTNFSIGAVSQSATASSGSSPFQSPQIYISGARNAGGTTGNPTGASQLPPAATRSPSGTNIGGNSSSPPPPVTGSTGATTPALPASAGIPARPAPTGTATTAPPNGAVVAARPGPGGSSAATASATVPPSTGIPARPGPSVSPAGTPGAPGATVSTGGMPARPGPTSATSATGPALATGNPVRPGPGAIAAGANSQGSLTLGTSAGSLSGAPAGVDLSVSTPDLHFSPVPALPGQNVTFTALIRNLGMSGAQGATVVFTLLADGRQAGISQPFIFNIAGHGTFEGSWTTRMPTGQQMQLIVTVSANGDANTTNNQAVLHFP